MRSINRGISFCALGLFFAAGCESVALMPRPDIDDRTGYDRAVQQDRYARDREAPQQDLYARDRAAAQQGFYTRDREARRGEVVGTVERVDDIRREISLRTDDRRNVVVKYDPRTVVIDRGREFSVADLRGGELVRTEPTRGEYVDVIHILEASRS
jgi:hypothetical protein